MKKHRKPETLNPKSRSQKQRKLKFSAGAGIHGGRADSFLASHGRRHQDGVYLDFRVSGEDFGGSGAGIFDVV